MAATRNRAAGHTRRIAATGPGSRVSGAHVIVWLLTDRLAVTSDCADFLRTVPVLPADPNRIEDVDTHTHAEDHCRDELRYAVTARVTLSKQAPISAGNGGSTRGERNLYPIVAETERSAITPIKPRAGSE